MSTFAVWGMTEVFAINDARKRVDTWDSKEKRNLTESEWLARVSERAEKTMKGKRSVQLSPKYDSPQWCREFIAAIQKNEIQCRDLCIKAQVKEEVEVSAKVKRPYRLTWIAEHQFDTHKAYAG